jgi:hypothetical protein
MAMTRLRIGLPSNATTNAASGASDCSAFFAIAWMNLPM